MKKQKRKLSSAVLVGTFTMPAAMSAVQANVVSANFCKSLSSSVSSFFTKKAGESLLKYMATKILPCVIVALGAVLLVTVARRIYRYFVPVEKVEEGKKLKNFFEDEDNHEALNENVKEIINFIFLKAYGKFLGIEGTIIEIPGSLVSEILYESYDIFSEEKPIDKNLEEAKRQNKVEFKILCISREKESEAFFLKLKLKQNEVWLDKTYETRYIKRERLIEFFNYVLEKASDTNTWEYKLKFEIKDGKACLVKVKKENSEVISKISIEEAKKDTTALESIIGFCYESNLKGIFEKTFIFDSMPEEFRIGGSICKAIFLLLSKHAKSLGIKHEGEDGITFEVRGAEAANFFGNISDDAKNKIKNLETVKFRILYISDNGYIVLQRLDVNSGKNMGSYYTKHSTTNVEKLVDFANFLLSKANKERKDGIEFKLEKVVKDQNTHVKLVKTKRNGGKQEFFITEKLVNKCKNLDDIFKEDLSCLNIEDEFNLNPDDEENKSLSLNFESNDDNKLDLSFVKKIDGEEPFLEGDENFGF